MNNMQQQPRETPVTGPPDSRSAMTCLQQTAQWAQLIVFKDIERAREAQHRAESELGAAREQCEMLIQHRQSLLEQFEGHKTYMQTCNNNISAKYNEMVALLQATQAELQNEVKKHADCQSQLQKFMDENASYKKVSEMRRRRSRRLHVDTSAE